MTEILITMKVKFYRIESLLSKLCTMPNGNFDDLFYNLAILHKTILKSNSMGPGFTPNDMLKINNPGFYFLFLPVYTC